MSRISLRRLEVLVSVVDRGSFRACAEALDLSPAAVSHQIQQLEQELRTRLFVRRRGRVCGLTESGQKTYTEAKSFLNHADKFAAEVTQKNPNENRRLMVCASPILEMYLARQITAFARSRPAVRVDLRRTDFEELHKQLTSGEAELGYFYGSGPVTDLESVKVWDEEVCICAHRSHPIFKRTGLALSDLQTTGFIVPPSGTHFRRCVDAVLARHGLPHYDIVFETGDAFVAREAVMSGVAVCMIIGRFLEDDARRFGVTRVPLRGRSMALEVRSTIAPGVAVDSVVRGLMSQLTRARPSAPP